MSVKDLDGSATYLPSLKPQHLCRRPRSRALRLVDGLVALPAERNRRRRVHHVSRPCGA